MVFPSSTVVPDSFRGGNYGRNIVFLNYLKTMPIDAVSAPRGRTGCGVGAGIAPSADGEELAVEAGWGTAKMAGGFVPH
jgi:hypothetical protein